MKFRIASYHPEDRYEIDDEIADDLRASIRKVDQEIETVIKARKTGKLQPLNHLTRSKQSLQMELARRLYVHAEQE